MSKRENAATLYLYVKNHIMKLLISGKYPPHSQLPTEFQLMDELDVGRATVRAALSQLEEEGTIYKRQGVGTFVSQRDKSFGLEPFISFSFMIKRFGLNDTASVLEKGEIESSGPELTKGWKKGTPIYQIKRLRCAESTPLGIENNYFLPNVYKQLDSSDFDSSIAHNLLANFSKPIERIASETIVREPTFEECKLMKIGVDENVVQITRWMYIADSDQPISYINFVIPTHVLEFPFLG